VFYTPGTDIFTILIRLIETVFRAPCGLLFLLTLHHLIVRTARIDVYSLFRGCSLNLLGWDDEIASRWVVRRHIIDQFVRFYHRSVFYNRRQFAFNIFVFEIDLDFLVRVVRGCLDSLELACFVKYFMNAR
jgi:hypothetical protein